MNESFEQALAHTRGKRQFTALVVNELLELSDYNAQMLSSISWQTLEELPHWCALSAEEQLSLRTACGAVLLASAFRKQISGAELIKFRDAVGEPVFRYLQSGNASMVRYEIDVDVFEAEQSLTERLSVLGSSVMLSTLGDSVVRALYVRKYGPLRQRLSADTAMEILAQAQVMLNAVPLQTAKQNACV